MLNVYEPRGLDQPEPAAIDLDDWFKKRGAVCFHDDRYPGQRVFRPQEGWIIEPLGQRRKFARYYFQKDGLEVGYYIYDLNSVHLHATPRAWGFPHESNPL